MDRPLRLGFPVKLMGRPDLRTQDTRRWQQGPHLKCSLELLDPVLDHLAAQHIEMYRLSSDIAPYATHPDLPQFHAQVADSDTALAEFGAKARALDIRLSFHPSQYVLLNSPDPALTARSIADLASQAEMLDRMGLGDEAVVVTHVGGVYDDREASRARWIAGWEAAPELVRRRLVLENDDVRFSAADVLWLHARTGVRLIFDHQHFWCLNPERLAMRATLERFLATWPSRVRAKIHFSTLRTEMRTLKRKVAGTRRTETVLRPPVWTGHADFTNPFEFATFMRMADGLDFDVMLEGKAKDLSLLRLRGDLARYAPDVAARFGATDAVASEIDAAVDDAPDVDEGAQPLAAA